MSCSGGSSSGVRVSLLISVCLEFWLGDDLSNGGEFHGRSRVSTLIDPNTIVNINLFTKVGRVSAGLGQLLVEVAGVLGVASSGTCGG